MACAIPYGGHKKLKPGLVASYDIRPGNGEDLFSFWRFINLSLTYLRRHLPTYTPGTHTWHLRSRSRGLVESTPGRTAAARGNSGQVVHPTVPNICKLVAVNGRWRSTVGKVTVGLAS